MSKLDGKTCLVTGATGGLGRELAHKLGTSGCELFLTATKVDELASLSEQLQREGFTVRGTLAVDLTDDQQLLALVQKINKDLDGLDILINNAGVFPVGPLSSTDPAAIDTCLDVNLKAAIVLARAFLPSMVTRGWGRIVNVASSSAYAGFKNTAVYCASKHGLLGFSRALDAEVRSSGIRVLSVAPGSIKTPMGRCVDGQDYETFLEPADVAATIVQAVELDGGMIVEELRLSRMEIR